MKCPKCRKEIEMVWIISKCQQRGWLKGKKIDNYDSVDEVLDTTSIECPECGSDIKKYIKE